MNYNKYKNVLETILKAAEENYYHNLFKDTKKATSKLWKTLGTIINPARTKKKNSINKLNINNEIITDKKDISNHINNYFCTIGKNLASEIPQGRHYATYLKNKVNETMFLEPIYEVEVTNEIQRLDNKKSPGHDNISPRILKACEPYIKTTLTNLYNYSIETATYPSSLKLAKVFALYKKKSKYLPENYRPISLLSCLDKIIEKLLHRRFMKFINKHKIIILNQYGFLAKHSTISALIDLVDSIRNIIEKGEYALGIYLDLKKAFDTVDHNILLGKLDHYGIRGHSNKFIKSYLSDRSQYTVVNGIISTTQSVETGVPQGSVLGPLFFLIYINDIINSVDDVKTILFADDTSLLYHHKNLNTLKIKAESGAKKVYDWLISNKLSISWEKTHFVIYHSTKRKAEGIQELSVYNFSIKRVNHVVYLGMRIDEHLKWDKHVGHVCNNLSKNFHMFYTIRNLLTDQLKKQLYYSLVHSRILYGIEIYGACSGTLLNKVIVMQNKLLKILYNRPFRTSTNELHAELKLLKVRDIYNVNILKFVYESINKNSIIQFHDYFLKHHRLHDHDTRNENNLYHRIMNTKYGESTLSFKGTELWNLLDNSIQKSKSIGIFKKCIKEKCLNCYNIS